MYSNSETITELLRSSVDWNASLGERLELLKQDTTLVDRALHAFELGEFIEHCSPDRVLAIAAYVLCYSADHNRLDALVKARELSAELGDFATVARLAGVQYKHDCSPELLLEEGVSWLDAGEPDRAIRPLMRACADLPGSELAKSSLQTARQEWPDVRAEIGRLKQAAQSAPTTVATAHILMQSVRTMRMLNTNDGVIDRYLLTAFRADPENRSVLGLLERRLPHLAYPDAFWAIYEERIANRDTLVGLVMELRRIATRLYPCVRYRGTSVRVVQRALCEAYDGGMTEIPGHLALHTLLFEHCQEAQLFEHYLKFAERGLRLPLPPLDRLFLALRGLRLVSAQFGDVERAHAFADVVEQIAPEHPILLEAQSSGLIGLSVPWKVKNRDNSTDDLASTDVDTQCAESSSDSSARDAELAVSADAEIREEIAMSSILPDSGAEDAELAASADAEVCEEIATSSTLADSGAGDLELAVSADAEICEGIATSSTSLHYSLNRGSAELPTSDGFGAKKNVANTIGKIPIVTLSSVLVNQTKAVRRSGVSSSGEHEGERAPRLTTPLAIEFVFDGHERRALTRDLSETGVFMVTSLLLEQKKLLKLKILLPQKINSLRTKPYELNGIVIRSMPKGYGVRFDEPSKIYISHFRALVEAYK